MISAARRKISRFFVGGSDRHAGKAFCAVVIACVVSEIEALLKWWRSLPVAGEWTGKDAVVL